MKTVVHSIVFIIRQNIYSLEFFLQGVSLKINYQFYCNLFVCFVGSLFKIEIVFDEVGLSQKYTHSSVVDRNKKISCFFWC